MRPAAAAATMLKRIRSRWHCHPMLRRGAVGVIGAAFLLVVARLALDVETLTWRCVAGRRVVLMTVSA
jgi:hypothetical protein